MQIGFIFTRLSFFVVPEGTRTNIPHNPFIVTSRRGSCRTSEVSFAAKFPGVSGGVPETPPLLLEEYF